jgi:hypothetical protein
MESLGVMKTKSGKKIGEDEEEKQEPEMKVR